MTRPRRFAASGALLLLLFAATAAVAEWPVRLPLDWLQLPGAEETVCPDGRTWSDPHARCLTTAMELKRLKREVRKAVTRRSAESRVHQGSWRNVDGVSMQWLVVDSGMHFLVHDAEAGVLAIVPAPTCLEGLPETSLPKTDTEPKVVNKVHAQYPEEARIQGNVGGLVVLHGLVGTDGRVSGICMVFEEPGGYGFARASREAVAAWRYEPARLDGRPVAVPTSISMDFSIR